MARWPDARAEEFAFAVRMAGIGSGARVVDVPAGGGYLRDHLPAGATLLAVEPSEAFAEGCRRRGVEVVGSSLHAEDVATGWADVVVSLAGVHHEDDPVALLRSWHRVVRPGGTVALIDVAEGSAPAAFLDGFVGDHNGEGHVGRYLSERAAELATSAGFVDVVVEDGNYCWWLPDAGALAAFCRGLFRLDDIDDVTLLDAIERGPGIEKGEGGRIGMRWGLRAVVARSAS